MNRFVQKKKIIVWSKFYLFSSHFSLFTAIRFPFGNYCHCLGVKSWWHCNQSTMTTHRASKQDGQVLRCRCLYPNASFQAGMGTGRHLMKTEPGLLGLEPCREGCQQEDTSGVPLFPRPVPEKVSGSCIPDSQRRISCSCSF